MKKRIFKIFNNGFTLIELLAVLVVLSVILVIAVPKIGNVMDESRKRVLQQSAESLLRKAKEVSMVNNEEEIIYTIENGAFSGDELKINGTLPNSGSIKINEDGTTEIAVHDDKYCALKSKNDDSAYVIDYDGYECRVTTPKACFTYTKTSTQVTITDYDNSCEKDVSIPTYIEGLPVTNIDSYSFYENQLTSVTIPNTVTSIGLLSFYNNQITSLTLPDNVTSIGSSAFENNFITSIEIPNGITTINYSVFANNRLANVIIPSSVTTIDVYAFKDNQIKKLTIPNSVTSIGASAFYNNQINNLSLSTNLLVIKQQAFENNFIENLTLPNGITTIDYKAFQNNKITNLNLPNSLISIGWASFETNLLTSLTIPNSISTIPIWVFRYNNLNSVTIPSNVTIESNTISSSFYTAYFTNNNKAGGTYTAPSQNGTWTKQP